MADLTKIDGTVGLFCVSDFKPDMPRVSGRQALACRLSVRLQTVRGRFPWWPTFGTDLRQFLLSKTSASVVASAAESECLKDEQVENVEVKAEFLNNGRALHLTLNVTDAAGPFVFTLTIDEAIATLSALQSA